MRHLLLAALAVTFVSATLVAPAEAAKSRATCTKQVKAKDQYLTAGGRCGEDCRTAITACMKGKKV